MTLFHSDSVRQSGGSVASGFLGQWCDGERELRQVKPEDDKSNQHKDEGSIFLGILVCWLLNVVHLGIAYLLFAHGERTLPAVFVLVGAIGLLQVGYVAPLWYLLRRRGKKRMARGLVMAAAITVLVNATFLAVIYING